MEIISKKGDESKTNEISLWKLFGIIHDCENRVVKISDFEIYSKSGDK